jgi:hypothetical protein
MGHGPVGYLPFKQWCAKCGGRRVLACAAFKVRVLDSEVLPGLVESYARCFRCLILMESPQVVKDG